MTLVDTATGPCVYFLTGEHRRILYIGSTGNFERRFKEHARTQPWWSLVTGAEYFLASSRAEAYEVEQWAIERYAPLFNERLMPTAENASPLLSTKEAGRAHQTYLDRAAANEQQAEKWRVRVLEERGVDLARQAVAS